MANFAVMLQVSERTIRRDILCLSCLYPIETIRGRYSGGIRTANWYCHNRKSLSSKQIELLIRLLKSLDGEDVVIMNSIILEFTLK